MAWEWLKIRLKEVGSNSSRFADAIDWDKSRVYELFSGKTKAIPNKCLEKAARHLQISLQELIALSNGDKVDLSPKAAIQEIPEKMIAIDVLNVEACCGNGIENFGENVIGRHLMSLPALRELTAAAPENIKIIKAIGDSMIPTINPDDMVWVDISFKHPSSDGLYLICVGNDLLIKRIQINPFDNSAEIKSDNPQYNGFKYNNFEDINVIGRIIYHVRKIG